VNTAPSNATPDQIGNMSGALVRDNHFTYTYVQNAPSMTFSSSYDSDNISHAFTINGNPIWSGSATGMGAYGGIHVVVVDRTNPNILVDNQWYPSDVCADEVGNHTESIGAYIEIGKYNTYAYLIFVAAFGASLYDPGFPSCTYNGVSYPNTARENWTDFAFLMNYLGGTWQTWFLMNYPNTQYPPLFNAIPAVPNFVDDYTLVGAFRDTAPYIGLNFVGAERSSVIARETELYPQSSEMEGVLTMDHQGYYSPAQYGHNLALFDSNDNTFIGDTSRLNPVAWPMPGDTSPQNAYTWFSQQLCCNDIRAAYVNQNVSPDVWYAQLQQLSYPNPVPPNFFSSVDFTDMQQQLGTEFQYLSDVRQLQNNTFSLFQEQQAAVPLLLQQAQNEVTQNLQVDLNTPVQKPKWESITGSVLGVLSAATGALSLPSLAVPQAAAVVAGIKTAIALGQLGLTVAADETNSSAGTSLKAQENLEVEAGEVAQNVVTTYNTNLSQIASQFDRIASDWGRLKTLGGPLAAGLMPWDNTAALSLLPAYDRVIRREFYTSLISANTLINYYPTVAVGPFNENTDFSDSDVSSGFKLCHYQDSSINPYWGRVFGQNGQANDEVGVLFYPNGTPDTLGSLSIYNNNHYPYDFIWSSWALVYAKNKSDTCPFTDTLPATFGLFDPLDPDNPDALGAYRLWWFTRNSYLGTNPAADDYTHSDGVWGSCDLVYAYCGSANN
jgi:hypothetical protein